MAYYRENFIFTFIGRLHHVTAANLPLALLPMAPHSIYTIDAYRSIVFRGPMVIYIAVPCQW
jgi:hypothetical protein